MTDDYERFKKATKDAILLWLFRGQCKEKLKELIEREFNYAKYEDAIALRDDKEFRIFLNNKNIFINYNG